MTVAADPLLLLLLLLCVSQLRDALCYELRAVSTLLSALNTPGRPASGSGTASSTMGVGMVTHSLRALLASSRRPPSWRCGEGDVGQPQVAGRRVGC